ncbi:MAG: hypothetical protein Q8M19_14610 [Reyranella sp.]|nr:hypothetical protein [Reyranella sp.]
MPLVDASGVAPVTSRERALAVREACLGWLPLGGLLARLADPVVRRWMRCSGTPYLGEINAVARALGRPGIWLLHGAYLFGCTALADEGREGPRLRRTLDWPFPGLGRLVEVVRRRGTAGGYLNVTWPGFVGVLTAVAPGRFAASINQAPMRRRTSLTAFLWLDYALNALDGLRGTGRLPPEHLLRHVFEICTSFDEARRTLETTPVARPVLFVLVGCHQGERVVIERESTCARVYLEDTVIANAWRQLSDGWRPRVCGEGTPAENNRRRTTAMRVWTGCDSDDFGWATAPVLNSKTRLTVEMCPAAGTLKVAGWEADGRGSATPATAFTDV